MNKKFDRQNIQLHWDIQKLILNVNKYTVLL